MSRVDLTGRELCRHCGKELANRPRGLGWKCYYTPGLREMYEPQTASGKAGARAAREETMADLDALEAEQRKNLPDWWWDPRFQGEYGD